MMEIKNWEELNVSIKEITAPDGLYLPVLNSALEKIKFTPAQDKHLESRASFHCGYYQDMNDAFRHSLYDSLDKFAMHVRMKFDFTNPLFEKAAFAALVVNKAIYENLAVVLRKGHSGSSAESLLSEAFIKTAKEHSPEYVLNHIYNEFLPAMREFLQHESNLTKEEMTQKILEVQAVLEENPADQAYFQGIEVFGSIDPAKWQKLGKKHNPNPSSEFTKE